uniref:Uncharacterized protein n=1 Tax=Arundo donax TaxID=35708 RepID=A0A0A8YP57_ARUDO
MMILSVLHTCTPAAPSRAHGAAAAPLPDSDAVAQGAQAAGSHTARRSYNSWDSTENVEKKVQWVSKNKLVTSSLQQEG